MRTRVIALALASAAVLALSVAAVAGEVVDAIGDGTATGLVTAVPLALVGAAWFTVGAYLARHRPRHPLGWLLAVVGLGAQAGVTGDVAGRAGWLGWDSSPVGVAVDVVGGLGIFLLIGLLPVLYPSGHLRGRGARTAAALTTLGAFLAQAQVLRARLDASHTWAFGPDVPGEQAAALWAPWLIYFGGVLAGWLLCMARLFRATRPLRQQLAWLLIALVAVTVTNLLGEGPVATALQAAALLLLPVAIAVGIVRYQLLDIDTAVPRVLTAGVLGLLVSAVYLGVTVLSGVGITGATAPSVLAAAAVALVLLPLHSRVRRLVDRFVYGTRADPARAVADLGAAVAAVPGGDMLYSVLDELARAFRATGARVRDRSGTVLAQTTQTDAAPALGAALTLAGEPIGTVELLAARTGSYSAADVRMLTVVSGTVALAVRAAALADQLENQRDAVLEASTAVRDRIRRDMHDGLGPSLTGLRLGLQALSDARAAGDHDRATAITDVLREESDRAVAEVRRVIDDLRPIDLDTTDLAAALRHRLTRVGAPAGVTVENDPLPPLPHHVEDGVYRVVSEAVANAHRHARADAVTVELRVVGRHLVASVRDDGVGIGPDAPAGVGLASMRARAAELGGTLDILSTSTGTTVTLTVPDVATSEALLEGAS